MNIRIRHVSYVIDFLDVDFNSDKISSELKEELETILIKNKITEPIDWELQFKASYSNSRYVLASKNRYGTFTSDKVKEVIIVIPIPLIEDVSWGVAKDQHSFELNHYDNIIKNFWVIDVSPNNYNNREEYIFECMRLGILKSLSEGLAFGGFKVKVV